MNINYVLSKMSADEKDAIISSIVRMNNRIQKSLDKTILILKSGSLVDDIESLVCQQFSISREYVYSEKKGDDFSGARRMLMYLLRVELGWSAKDVATRMNRDRTTIVVGVNKAKDWLKYDKDFIQKYKNVKKNMQNT